MRRLKWFLGIGVVIVITLFLGPKVETPVLNTDLPSLTPDLEQLEAEIDASEKGETLIKKDNEARIVWFDSAYQKTPFSVVYLHGFGASQGEGDPIHREFAQRYGCNLYLSRLYAHGLNEEEPLLKLTAEKLIESAKSAVAVGQQLGEKVILMSTSTGGTVSLYLASAHPEIHSLILYSPNISLYDPNSFLLSMPWGLQMARLILGGDYYTFEAPEEDQKYWNTRYRVEALTHLQALVESTMSREVFQNVQQPTFLGYYYKNEEEQDQTVSIPAILEMYEQLGTPESAKRKIAFPNAGDHVIASRMTSKDLENVRQETFKFAEEVLGLQPVAVHDTLAIVEGALE